MKRVNLFIGIVMVLLMSCEMKDEIGGKYIDERLNGKLDLQLSGEDATTLQPNFLTRTNRKSADDLSIEIYNDQNSCVKRYASYSAMKQEGMTIALPAGKYSLKAFSGEIVDAAWDTPYYEGVEPFVIEAGMVTRVKMVCAIQNVKVSIHLSENFRKTFKEDYSILVTNLRGILMFDKNETRSGYFSVTEALQVTVKATTILENRLLTHTLNLRNNSGGIVPKDYFKITLDIKQPIGNLKDPLLNVSIETNDRDIALEVPTVPEGGGEDGTPEPDVNAPTLNGIDFNLDEPFRFIQSESPEVKINIATENSIQKLEVRIDSPFLTEEVLGQFGIPISFDLAHLDPKLESNFKVIGLIGEEPILGQKNLIFNISPFMGLLEPGVHKFHLSVTDALGRVANKCLTIEMLTA